MTAEVQRALDERWPRAREAAHTQVAIIDEYARAGEGGTSTQHRAASSAAHRLNGNLGMFGRREASAIAAAIEELLAIELLSPSSNQLRILIDRLGLALRS
jgi:HPt (histidine-containing phosphotransfer) domain-containing protein